MILRKKIDEYFEKYPTQKKVVYSLLTYGIKIKNNKLYCGPIQISDTKFARAINIDRKAIINTINALKKKPKLWKFFSNLSATCSLENAAPIIGWGVLEIIPDDPSSPGIIAGVSTILAKNNINIRQAIGNDYDLHEEPRLYIITENEIPMGLIKDIKKVKGIKGVTIF